MHPSHVVIFFYEESVIDVTIAYSKEEAEKIARAFYPETSPIQYYRIKEIDYSIRGE